ncbi:29246_t:CDS:2, partial [Racocetra persica]
MIEPINNNNINSNIIEPNNDDINNIINPSNIVEPINNPPNIIEPINNNNINPNIINTDINNIIEPINNNDNIINPVKKNINFIKIQNVSINIPEDINVDINISPKDQERSEVDTDSEEENSIELNGGLGCNNIDVVGKPMNEYSELLEADFKTIGNGGFAVVYSVVFEGNKYALKNLNGNICMGKKIFYQFRREIKILYKVDHPNIIKFHGVSRDQTSGNFMMVLQFANDGNLRDYLRKKIRDSFYEISWVELIKIAGDIAIG